MHNVRHTLQIALVPAFLIALWLPLACAMIGFDPTPRPNENRVPATAPDWPAALADLKTFPPAFEAYYNDHFGGRNSLVYFFLFAKSVVLGVSPSDMAVVGKDDWTYLGNDQQLAASRGTQPFSEAQLAEWQKTLESRRDIAALHGAQFLAMWGPDKSSIYPEYLPAWLQRVSETSNLDQLMAYMAEHSDVPIADLRPRMLEQKTNSLLYLHSNSHWNAVGAYAAYCTIAETVQPWLPTFRPVMPDDLIVESRPRNDKDFEAEIDIDYYKAAAVEDARIAQVHSRKVAETLPGLKQPEKTQLRIFENEDASLPRLVIFHDSFGYSLVPFLNESFSRVTYVREPTYSEEIIAAEKPDLVIFLRVERSLTPVAPSK